MRALAGRASEQLRSCQQVARKWNQGGASAEDDAHAELDFSHPPSASEGEHGSANGSAVDLTAKSRIDVSDEEDAGDAEGALSLLAKRCRTLARQGYFTCSTRAGKCAAAGCAPAAETVPDAVWQACRVHWHRMQGLSLQGTQQRHPVCCSEVQCGCTARQPAVCRASALTVLSKQQPAGP